MKTIVLLNGPPRCGKTTIARYLEKIHDFNYLNFSDTIRKVQSILFPLDDYESFKFKELYPGYTGRDFMIDFAESFVKPKLGPGFFANSLADAFTAFSIAHGISNTVIGDLGFESEYQTITDRLTRLSEVFGSSVRIELWHVVRDGTDFVKDSRDYIGTPTRVIENNSSTEVLYNQVNIIIKSLKG